MIMILAATANGRRHAAHLAVSLSGAVASGPDRPLSAAVADAWGSADALVLCMATGAAVRLVAPHLRDKRTDPAVVAVDDAGRYAVALAGGHAGGNELARRVADALGAEAVITTASDLFGVPALNTLGATFGLQVDPGHADLATVGARLVAGEPLRLWRSRPWPTGPLPETILPTDHPDEAHLLVTDELVEPRRPAVVYRPRSLVVGVGASRGASPEEVGALVDALLADAGLSPRSVAHLATAEVKADEEGILAAAAERDWPVVTHPVGVLAAVGVPNPSEIVRRAVGTASVAEAAALAGGGELVAVKRKAAHATAAIARLPVRGRLALVSTGPGDARLVPPLAREALSAAEVVIGLDQYVDRVRGWIRPGCRVEPSPIGEEVARAAHAVALARAGRSVALVSGGDVGVYAMASPALELAGDDVEILVVPGVTAATAAAALLGSPLGHDHCAVSLSDLLTSWEVVRRRLKAAAEGDFVVSLYNPRSSGRRWQLEEARLLLLDHRKPDTPVGVVRDAYRPGQRVEITTLGELDTATVDMSTIVVVGSSQTRLLAGRMVTSRGYR
jgi:cobalt-precorrin 5A hydrolase/precorrin-3B C17-methyltransferase